MQPNTNQTALVLFAHGSSDPTWAAPFEAILQQVQQSQAERARIAARDVPVALAYLERMSPSLDETVAALALKGITRITLVPLFLAVGGHIRNDLPTMVANAAQQHNVRIDVRGTIGESAKMQAAIVDWILGSAE
jgi:sirohydrochlorin cobaltochelatase